MTSQDRRTALELASSGGRKDMVELLLDRGADLEAKDNVSAATACSSATGRAGPHGRAWGRGDDDGASVRGAPVAGRRVRRRWRGATSVEERWCDKAQ